MASSLDNVNKNIGNVWNSDEVRESEPSQIGYIGTDLKSGATYYSKVRLWDEANRTGDYSFSKSFQITTKG